MLAEQRSLSLLFKKLATFRTDAELPCSFNAMKKVARKLDGRLSVLVRRLDAFAYRAFKHRVGFEILIQR